MRCYQRFWKVHSPASRGPQSEGVVAAGMRCGRTGQARARFCCPAIPRLLDVCHYPPTLMSESQYADAEENKIRHLQVQ